MKKIWNWMKGLFNAHVGIDCLPSVTDADEDMIPCDERDPNVIHNPRFDFREVKPLWDERGR